MTENDRKLTAEEYVWVNHNVSHYKREEIKDGGCVVTLTLNNGLKVRGSSIQDCVRSACKRFDTSLNDE